jgi:hypothetical protein
MSRLVSVIALALLNMGGWAQEKSNDEADNQLSTANSVGHVYMINLNRWGYSRAMGFKIDGWMLKADRRCYSFIDKSAGLHEVEFGKEKISIAVQAGKSYYFTLIEQGMGWGGFRIARLSQEEGDFDLKMLKADKKQIDAAAAYANRNGHPVVQ